MELNVCLVVMVDLEQVLLPKEHLLIYQAIPLSELVVNLLQLILGMVKISSLKLITNKFLLYQHLTLVVLQIFVVVVGQTK